MPTIEDIKAMINALEFAPYTGTQIASGTLQACSGLQTEYQLMLGWDLVVANRCDDTWGIFNIQLMKHIESLNLDSTERGRMLTSIQIDDSHWRWLNKSIIYNSDEYKWFFLIAEDRPQAACLIYHPKPSALDGQGIFYIEYVAVAPWNRTNPMTERNFKGLGKKIVTEISSYSISTLGLRPGFSLHSLPRARGFYEALGMVHISELDKDQLQYFEMPEPSCAAAET